MEEVKTKYSVGDLCTHCGGKVTQHCAGERIVLWCDDCGSNNPSSAPNVTLTFSK